MKKVFTLMVFLMSALCTFGQVFTDDLHVTSGAGRTTDYAQKEVELTKVSDDVYKFTFRNSLRWNTRPLATSSLRM